jgi:hypothetical protein
MRHDRHVRRNYSMTEDCWQILQNDLAYQARVAGEKCLALVSYATTEIDEEDGPWTMFLKPGGEVEHVQPGITGVPASTCQARAICDRSDYVPGRHPSAESRGDVGLCVDVLKSAQCGVVSHLEWRLVKR